MAAELALLTLTNCQNAHMKPSKYTDNSAMSYLSTFHARKNVTTFPHGGYTSLVLLLKLSLLFPFQTFEAK